MSGDAVPRFVVWGGNALAQRLVGELMNTYAAHVTVIVPSASADQAPEIVELVPEDGDPALRPAIIVAPRLNQEVFRQAGIETAAAVALVDRDDVANVDAALIAREVSPTVRLVVRLFNPVLGDGITTMLGDCGVLSGSEFAAPAFVAAALGNDTPTYVRLPDELLMAARRADVGDHPDDVLCGLAITEGLPEPVRLPADEDAADLVLVRAPSSRPRPVRRRRPHPMRATRLLFGRNLRLALLALAGVLVTGTATLALTRQDTGLLQAAYLAVLTALGGADADTGASVAEKAVAVLLVVTGVALIPTVTALIVDVIVNARLALAAGGLTEPVSGHVIVVGLGNIGTRVIRELHDFGLDVVAVDRMEHARGVAVARELRIPVLVRDANNAEALRAASVETCRALLVLTSDDVTNLETALIGRAVHREAQRGDGGARLRVVLRLFDEGFARRVKRAFGIDHSRSVSYLAAPAFAAAMMGREVVGAISVGRRVLLVAELPVGAGSELEGRLCPEVGRPGEVRLIAVRTGRAGQTLWTLPDRRPLVRTDRLLVVATRAGLAGLLARTAVSPNPPPLVEPTPLRLLNTAARPRPRPPALPPTTAPTLPGESGAGASAEPAHPE
ncbi:NAD-binding protein [Plantactinospora endophytica]|uniref:Potassium transporter TrkA n=1 Tax=Plantactinospora endophytica TaxID=673535 RepID=A0ABQ4E3K9_9ACTN|nr:NAD-binding protein [Plantactinospora endophytica]GIG89287.1 potassium transporter TrkA [Plantactinospora endophytica]